MPFLWGHASFKYQPFLPFNNSSTSIFFLHFPSALFLHSPCFQSSSITKEESMRNHLTWMLVWDFSLKSPAQTPHQTFSWNLQWESQTSIPSLKISASLKLAISAISSSAQTKIFTCTGIYIAILTLELAKWFYEDVFWFVIWCLCRGDQGFCSVECRNRQIVLDEMKELESSTKQMVASYRQCCSEARQETRLILKDLRMQRLKSRVWTKSLSV